MYRCLPGDYLTPSRLTVMEEKSKKVFVLGMRSNLEFVVDVVEIYDLPLRGELFIGGGYEVTLKHHRSRWPFYGACGAA